MFVKGRFYEHEAFMDLCVEVLEVLSNDPTTLRVQYVNKGWVGKPFYVHDPSVISIRDESMWRPAKLVRMVDEAD